MFIDDMFKGSSVTASLQVYCWISSVTVFLLLPSQHCGTVCLDSFDNRTSPSDNLNDCLKRLCLVSKCLCEHRAPPHLLTKHNQWWDVAAAFCTDCSLTVCVAGSRAGAIIAACWATMRMIGRDGYVDATREIIATTRHIEAESVICNHLFVQNVHNDKRECNTACWTLTVALNWEACESNLSLSR